MNYSKTLNLPSTSFPMKANLPKKELEILKFWKKKNLYQNIREKYKGRKKFILHDGPPYANGDIHVGTALNKILKDIVVKYKTMRGFDSPYLPGWDCHGMPIEHQVINNLKVNISKISLIEFREKCRNYALHYVNVQREQFERLGVFGEWNSPYLTLEYKYEATIIDIFAKLAKNGFIYKGLKPVLWCINCSTALADAEIEYSDEISPAVYVKFELIDSLKKVCNILNGKKAYFLIWTTTPWTLPANLAIALHPDINYVIFEYNDEYFVMADSLFDTVTSKLSIKKFEVIKNNILGKEFEGLKYKHPFIDRVGVVILADHVTSEDGTGCVHTAPGHGEEDFVVGKKYNLPTFSPVDDKGCFTSEFPVFIGKRVFDADPLIINLLKEKKVLLLDEKFSHSYPHCWRCHKPVIFRTTEQWFLKVDNNNLRKKMINIIPDVKWIPPTGEMRIKGMIENRPDWCLSRQRYWGVPIPILSCVKCNEPVLEEGVFNKITNIVLKEGTDVWFIKEAEEFLPAGFQCLKCKGTKFKKEKDILDVWFDSACSHFAVLKGNSNLSWPSDIYLEGSDQHRGWFQVSLITSMAIEHKASFKIVLTHGYTVDGEGKKMSKSLGNLVSGKEACIKYGADIVRLWVASSDYRDDIRFSEEILDRLMDAYRKIRNTARYLISNLYDFNKEYKIKYDELTELDKFILHKLQEVIQESTDAFENYEYYRFYQIIYNFCVVDLSSFYLDILKDRIYIHSADSVLRRTGQYVLYELLVNITKLIAPVLSFTSEEIWQELVKKGEKNISVHTTDWPEVKKEFLNENVKLKFSKIISLRDKVLRLLEDLRDNKVIGHPYEAKVILNISDEKELKLFKEFEKDLASIFIVSKVILNKAENREIKVEKADGDKCERCWNYNTSVGADIKHKTLCNRCIEIIKELKLY